MKIVKAFPPNYAVILERFPSIKNRNILFAYGDILYSPDVSDLPDHLMKHEETHQRQQAKIGVEEWWKRYLVDDEFRLTQEVEAYQNQWKCIKETLNRSERRRLLQLIVKDLSGEMYGNLVSKDEAEELITSHGEIADALPSRGSEETHLGATPSERTN